MYHQNGVVSMKGEAVHGERDGEWMVWDENKKIVTIGHYIAGKEEGLKTVWYPNGAKRYEGIISNDKRVGVWKFFKEDGTILDEKNYDLEGKK
jgi:antitoxin component YwqK of YwqJK toxin-antitoxin module